MNSAVIDNQLIYQKDTRRLAGWAAGITVAVHAAIAVWIIVYAPPAVQPIAQSPPLEFNLAVQVTQPKALRSVRRPRVTSPPLETPPEIPVFTPAPIVAPDTPVVEAVATPIPEETAPSPALATEEPPLITATDYASNPAPPYPSRALKLGQQGKVMIHVTVRPDGSVREAYIAQSSGFTLLDDTALTAVRAWRFTPLPSYARMVDRTADVPIHFH